MITREWHLNVKILLYYHVPLFVKPSIVKEQAKYLILELVIQYVLKGEKLKGWVIAKIGSKAPHKHLLLFERLEMKWCVSYCLCISNGIESNQLVLPTVYHQAVIQILYDDYSHWGLGCILALARKRFYWSMMYRDIVECVANCHRCMVITGHFTGLHTESASLVANNSQDLMCIDLQRSTHLTMVKKMFSCFLLNIANSTRLHYQQSEGTYCCKHFSRQISMKFQPIFIVTKITVLKMKFYYIKQSLTMPYNLCGNSQCERFNHTLHVLLKPFLKEQNAN